MKPNKELKQNIFDIIDNQMKADNPPETKMTYNRLINQGYSDSETRQMIGQCISVEIYEILKHKKPFDEKRYIKNLNNLPKEPFDDK